MLPAEFPFPVPRWTQRVLRFVLGEAFLGFLAIAAVALTLLPMLFPVARGTERLLELCQWGIVALFAAEYLLGLASAPSKKTFVLDPWRLLDLFTILVPMLTILPNVSEALRTSPVFRLARVVRIAVMGARASGVIIRDEQRHGAAAAIAPLEVSKLARHDAEPVRSTWSELLEWVSAPGDEWYHAANLSPDALRDLTASLGMPHGQIEDHLFTTGYPHIETSADTTLLFVWLPESTGDRYEVDRNGLLLLATKQSVLTLSRRQSGLLPLLGRALHSVELPHAPFVVRMTSALLRALVDQNEAIVGRFERELHALEEVPVRESRPQFLEHTFRLKKELAAAQADLWRLKGIVANLAESRVRLPASDADAAAAFRVLQDELDYLYETVVNTKEGLLSVIDLHLNVVSFEMNRVMRVLAVVSVLGLVPAVIGGLFGMNLNGNPWPFTLPQVTFAVCLSMVLGLYLFFVKGWLR